MRPILAEMKFVLAIKAGNLEVAKAWITGGEHQHVVIPTGIMSFAFPFASSDAMRGVPCAHDLAFASENADIQNHIVPLILRHHVLPKFLRFIKDDGACNYKKDAGESKEDQYSGGDIKFNSRNLEIVELLSTHPRLTVITDIDGRNALAYCAQHGSPSTFELILFSIPVREDRLSALGLRCSTPQSCSVLDCAASVTSAGNIYPESRDVSFERQAEIATIILAELFAPRQDEASARVSSFANTFLGWFAAGEDGDGRKAAAEVFGHGQEEVKLDAAKSWVDVDQLQPFISSALITSAKFGHLSVARVLVAYVDQYDLQIDIKSVLNFACMQEIQANSANDRSRKASVLKFLLDHAPWTEQSVQIDDVQFDVALPPESGAGAGDSAGAGPESPQTQEKSSALSSEPKRAKGTQRSRKSFIFRSKPSFLRSRRPNASSKPVARPSDEINSSAPITVSPESIDLLPSDYHHHSEVLSESELRSLQALAETHQQLEQSRVIKTQLLMILMRKWDSFTSVKPLESHYDFSQGHLLEDDDCHDFAAGINSDASAVEEILQGQHAVYNPIFSLGQVRRMLRRYEADKMKIRLAELIACGASVLVEDGNGLCALDYARFIDLGDESLRLHAFLLIESAAKMDIMAEFLGRSLVSEARDLACLPEILAKALEAGQKIDILEVRKDTGKSLLDEVCELCASSGGDEKHTAHVGAVSRQGIEGTVRVIAAALQGGGLFEVEELSMTSSISNLAAILQTAPYNIDLASCPLCLEDGDRRTFTNFGCGHFACTSCYESHKNSAYGNACPACRQQPLNVVSYENAKQVEATWSEAERRSASRWNRFMRSLGSMRLNGNSLQLPALF